MPLLVASYTFYNTLALAAPEIQSLWAMAPMPGTVQEDGSIDRSVACTLTGCVIFQKMCIRDSTYSDHRLEAILTTDETTALFRQYLQLYCY